MMGKPDTIDFDKVYHSKFDGDYIMLREIERSKHGHRQVIIKFLETGNEQVVEYLIAKNGTARDKKKRGIDTERIYYSRSFGPFKMLRKMDYKKDKGNHILVEIEFIETGTVKVVRLADALVGNIRDDYRPTIWGVACIGNGSSYHPAYEIWVAMIARCYSSFNKNYIRYGARGVRVCDKWLCFEGFLEDLPYIDGYEDWLNHPGEYHLDKDAKQLHLPKYKRVYSLETCTFLPAVENTEIAMMEKYDMEPEDLYKAYINYWGHEIYLGTFNNRSFSNIAYINAINNLAPDRSPYEETRISPSDLIKYNLDPKIMCKIVK